MTNMLIEKTEKNLKCHNILNQALLKLYQNKGTKDSLRNYQKVIKSSLRDATSYFGFIEGNPAGDLQIPRVLSFESKKTP